MGRGANRQSIRNPRRQRLSPLLQHSLTLHPHLQYSTHLLPTFVQSTPIVEIKYIQYIPDTQTPAAPKPPSLVPRPSTTVPGMYSTMDLGTVLSQLIAIHSHRHSTYIMSILQRHAQDRPAPRPASSLKRTMQNGATLQTTGTYRRGHRKGHKTVEIGVN